MSEKENKFRFRFPLWAKSLLVLIVSVSVVSIVAINFFSNTLKSATRNFYIEQATKTADTLSIYVDKANTIAVRDKVFEIYDGLKEEQKVENSDWGSPEWETYLDYYNEVLEMPAYQALLAQIKTFHTRPP